jgi:hypothetical protein
MLPYRRGAHLGSTTPCAKKALRAGTQLLRCHFDLVPTDRRKCETYSNHDLQAASQAILIYTVMRLADQSSDHNDLELPLLNSLRVRYLASTAIPFTTK